jgi:hypothetical protein
VSRSAYNIATRREPPLDYIKGSTANEIRCVLRVTPLDGFQYEALSYTWALRPKRTASISSGENTRQAFEPTSTEPCSNFGFLATNEPSGSTPYVSNQDDVAERNQQVTMMRDIYTHATRVVVWLGEAQDSGVSVDVINQLPDTTRVDAKGQVSSDVAVALREICSQKYWTMI